MSNSPKKPEDTSKLKTPTRVLLGLMGVPGAAEDIERMEADGQKQLVESDSLPSEIMHWNSDTDGSVYAAMAQLGFEWGMPFKEDPLFRPAILPEGWKRAGTSHSMHSDVLDQYGRKRVGVFYKAAFYDRRAHMSFNSCLEHGMDYGEFYEENGNDRLRIRVEAPLKDGTTKVLWEKIVELPDKEEDRFSDRNRALERAAKDECTAFLEKNYPNYRSALAYWDDF